MSAKAVCGKIKVQDSADRKYFLKIMVFSQLKMYGGIIAVRKGRNNPPEEIILRPVECPAGVCFPVLP